MALFTAFLLVLVLIMLLRPLGRKFALYDVPAGRKNHMRPVLVIGGIAMVAAFKLIVSLGSPMPNSVDFLLLALLVTCVVGFIDDLHHLSSRWLFLAQILAATVMIWFGGTAVANLGNLLGMGVIHTGPLAIVFSLICILGVINAVNMADGMDGLAGLLVLSSCVWFAVLAYLVADYIILDLILVTVGGVLGFLCFNMRSRWNTHASIFMGNAGSLSLGLLISWFAIELCGKQLSPVTPITAVWIIGLPLLDMSRVMVARIRLGKSPFVADHLHIHHMLSSIGYTVSEVVFIKAGLSLVLGGIGVGAWYLGVAEWVMFYVFLMAAGVYFYLAGAGWHHVCHATERRRQPRQS